MRMSSSRSRGQCSHSIRDRLRALMLGGQHGSDLEDVVRAEHRVGRHQSTGHPAARTLPPGDDSIESFARRRRPPNSAGKSSRPWNQVNTSYLTPAHTTIPSVASSSAVAVTSAVRARQAASGSCRSSATSPTPPQHASEPDQPEDRRKSTPARHRSCASHTSPPCADRRKFDPGCRDTRSWHRSSVGQSAMFCRRSKDLATSRGMSKSRTTASATDRSALFGLGVVWEVEIVDDRPAEPPIVLDELVEPTVEATASRALPGRARAPCRRAGATPTAIRIPAATGRKARRFLW